MGSSRINPQNMRHYQKKLWVVEVRTIYQDTENPGEILRQERRKIEEQGGLVHKLIPEDWGAEIILLVLEGGTKDPEEIRRQLNVLSPSNTPSIVDLITGESEVTGKLERVWRR